MTLIREFASAKVNLTLKVLGKRPDGYHELQSLVAFAATVGDVVTLDTSRPAGVTVSGPFAGSLAGANLIETTMKLIAQEIPGIALGAVHLEKNLPIAAGIGGGSSDAAAVIRAVTRANDIAPGDIDWTPLALRLGADVPVCLASRLSWMTGTGERVQPLVPASPVTFHAIAVNPLLPVPADKTAQVFRALAAPALAAQSSTGMPAATTRDEITAVVLNGSNSLEPAARAILPGIGLVLEAIARQPGCRVARMSGGGPTCFGLFDDANSASAAAISLRQQHPDWWIKSAELA